MASVDLHQNGFNGPTHSHMVSDIHTNDFSGHSPKWFQTIHPASSNLRQMAAATFNQTAPLNLHPNAFSRNSHCLKWISVQTASKDKHLFSEHSFQTALMNIHNGFNGKSPKGHSVTHPAGFNGQPHKWLQWTITQTASDNRSNDFRRPNGFRMPDGFAGRESR